MGRHLWLRPRLALRRQPPSSFPPLCPPNIRLHCQPPTAPISRQPLPGLPPLAPRRRYLASLLFRLPMLHHLARRLALARPSPRRPWRVRPLLGPLRGLSRPCRLPSCLSQARHPPQASRVGGSVPGLEGLALRVVSARHRRRHRGGPRSNGLSATCSHLAAADHHLAVAATGNSISTIIISTTRTFIGLSFIAAYDLAATVIATTAVVHIIGSPTAVSTSYTVAIAVTIPSSRRQRSSIYPLQSPSVHSGSNPSPGHGSHMG